MDNRIKVGVRIRPLSQKEISEGASNTVVADHGGRILINSEKKANFNFDWSFDTSADQRAVYDSMCKPLIDKCSTDNCLNITDNSDAMIL
eukprot:scaffold1435_cov162-Ochromonas_danica.AAC.2